MLELHTVGLLPEDTIQGKHEITLCLFEHGLVVNGMVSLVSVWIDKWRAFGVLFVVLVNFWSIFRFNVVVWVYHGSCIWLRINHVQYFSVLVVKPLLSVINFNWDGPESLCIYYLHFYFFFFLFKLALYSYFAPCLSGVLIVHVQVSIQGYESLVLLECIKVLCYPALL